MVGWYPLRRENLYTVAPDGSNLNQLTHYPPRKTVLLGES